ncbi:hypothetical protein DM790_12165 [Flavobacterium collinsii]|nr:hypothetical protein [Flavobacterium collinsii]
MKVRFLKINFMKIYKYIYYATFLQSRKRNTAPEIPVYALLSLVQTNNLIVIINLFLFLTKVDINYDIRKIGIVGSITFYVINYYYFSLRGNGSKIINDKNYSLGQKSFWLDIFSFMSFFLTALTYYFYKEL